MFTAATLWTVVLLSGDPAQRQQARFALALEEQVASAAYHRTSTAKDYPAALAFAEKALVLAEKLYPPRLFPDGTIQLANAQYRRTWATRANGKSDPALTQGKETVLAYRKLGKAYEYTLPTTLQLLARIHRDRKEYAAAADLDRESVEIVSRLYSGRAFPKGHDSIVTAHEQLATDYELLQDWAKSEASYRAALDAWIELRKTDNPDKEVRLLWNVAWTLNRQKRHADAAAAYEQAIARHRTLLPAEQFPDKQSDLGHLLYWAGTAWDYAKKPAIAVKHFESAAEVRKKLHPDGHPDLANTYRSIGIVQDNLKAWSAAAAAYEKAAVLYGKLDPAGSWSTADCLYRQAWAIKTDGHYRKAIPILKHAVDVARRHAKREPTQASELGSMLFNLGFWLDAKSEAREQRETYLEAVPVLRKNYPDGHENLAWCLNNLGFVYRDEEKYARAGEYFEEAVREWQRVYPREQFPDGHRDLAETLDNLAWALLDAERYDGALCKFGELLAVRTALAPQPRFPHGDLDTAKTYNGIGVTYSRMGDLPNSLKYYEIGRGMLEPQHRDRPDDHDTMESLATAWSNIGNIHRRSGRPAESKVWYRKAAQLAERLHPLNAKTTAADLRATVEHWGSALDMSVAAADLKAAEEAMLKVRAIREHLLARAYTDEDAAAVGWMWSMQGIIANVNGDNRAARDALEQSLNIFRQLMVKKFATASAAEAMEHIYTMPPLRDLYLSSTHALPTAETPRTYDHVWGSRAPLMRLLEWRSAARRVAASGRPAVRTAWADLLATRDTLSAAVARSAPAEELQTLTEKKETLERQLAAALPNAPSLQDADRDRPADLAAALPPDAVFIDIITYHRITLAAFAVLLADPEDADPRTFMQRMEAVAPRQYAAFVVTKGKPAVRIELGAAKELDATCLAWREKLLTVARSPAHQAELDRAATVPATALRKVWDKLAAHFPTNPQTVYVAADGELTRLPWAALPGSKPDTVLLEDYAVATVPHGSFLLSALRQPPGLKDGPVLAVGGVHPDLPGTKLEVDRLLELTGTRATVALDARTATAPRLVAELPKARVAHVATHGFFAADKLARAKAMALVVDANAGQTGRKSSPQAALARNPLAFTGLLLAGTADKVLTSESILDLPLDGLQLMVLSACETALGDVSEGDGVLGLQRAFHLAGCRQVVGSLWSINDAATAAVMDQFYRGLLVEKKPPLAALREAQLAIYRNPGRVAAWAAGDRAAPVLGKTKAVDPSAVAAPAGGGKAPPRLWAAFVLSGDGR